ncbi:MAG: hypothetical protein ACP5M8_02925 [Caldisphaera sp.]|jgi:hypothetical protein
MAKIFFNNILTTYLKKVYIIIALDIIIDIILLFLAFQFLFLLYLKEITILIIIASTTLLIFISYIDYRDFKSNTIFLKNLCKRDNLIYSEKKNSISCKINDSLKICLALESDRIYITKIDKCESITNDTNDFYCARFDNGELLDKNDMRIFEGYLKIINENNVWLCKGKSIVINNPKNNRENILKSIEYLTNNVKLS